MSAWRRHAAALLPEHKMLIDRAESPAVLWQRLYALSSSRADDADLLRRVFQFASKCCGLPDAAVREAVASWFYEKLFDGDEARLHFQKHLRETDFLALEPVLRRHGCTPPGSTLFTCSRWVRT